MAVKMAAFEDESHLGVSLDEAVALKLADRLNYLETVISTVEELLSSDVTPNFAVIGALENARKSFEKGVSLQKTGANPAELRIAMGSVLQSGLTLYNAARVSMKVENALNGLTTKVLQDHMKLQQLAAR